MTDPSDIFSFSDVGDEKKEYNHREHDHEQIGQNIGIGLEETGEIL